MVKFPLIERITEPRSLPPALPTHKHQACAVAVCVACFRTHRCKERRTEEATREKRRAKKIPRQNSDKACTWIRPGMLLISVWSVMGLHIDQARDAHNVRYGRSVTGLHIDQTTDAHNDRYGRSVKGPHIDQTRDAH